MKKKFVFIIFSLVVSIHLAADNIEFLRCITGRDTIGIYSNDIAWITWSEFKLTTEASIKLNQINPSGSSFEMYYCNENMIWEKIWPLIEGKVTANNFKPDCIIWIKRGMFDEKDDVYRYKGKNIFVAAEKFKIRTKNPNLKKVHLSRNFSFMEVKITNHHLIHAISKYVISDPVFTKDNSDSILVVNLKKRANPVIYSLLVRKGSYSTLSREIDGQKYFFSRIDGVSVFLHGSVLSSWFKTIARTQKMPFKECYILNMDNWKIVHDHPVFYEWRFEYNLKDNKISFLEQGLF